MAWRLTGDLIEACSCNVFCPCWYGVPEVAVPDKGYCAGFVAFRVRDGNSDGVNLAGRTVVLSLDFPGANFFDGNATTRLYTDSAASTEQQRELESIFQGQKGGPMAMLAPMISKWLPTRSSDIRVDEQGDNVKVSVSGVGEVESRPLKDQAGNGFELRGGGFVGGLGLEVAKLSQTTSRWSDADLPRIDTKSGARGNFTWNG